MIDNKPTVKLKKGKDSLYGEKTFHFVYPIYEQLKKIDRKYAELYWKEVRGGWMDYSLCLDETLKMVNIEFIDENDKNLKENKMKLITLLNEIEEKEVVGEAEFTTKSFDVKDEVGKFFVVEKPRSKNTTIEDIVFESDVFYFANQIRGGLKFENIIGLYKQKSDARREGMEALKAYETQLKEMEDAMESFRSTKKDIEEKKKIAREKIEKLKQ
jgi:hypothetical protein